MDGGGANFATKGTEARGVPLESTNAPEANAGTENVLPPGKAVESTGTLANVVDGLVLGFFVAVGIVVALCVLRVAYSAYRAILRWRDFQDYNSSSDDDDYELGVEQPPHELPQQQQAKWINHTEITIVIHPGEFASLAIPDSQPILHDHFCTKSRHE